MKTGVYPGTFDPITLGHMDIIRRGREAGRPAGDRGHHQSVQVADVQRRGADRDGPREIDGIGGDIGVVSFDSLLMDFAEREGAAMIVRGLRAVADFEYEYQMAGMNQQLNDRIETVFLMADVSLQPIASRLVKEIALYGGDIGKFVSAGGRRRRRERVERLGRKGS
jgi:pantetheine-phosphate adenylyltransferase